MLGPALPPGWELLATAPDAPCRVLAHAEQGVILLDLSPAGAPGLETRLGHTMAAAGLRDGPGRAVPVWYMRLEPAQLPRFAELLRAAMAEQPPQAALPPGWVAALVHALRSDPGWSAGQHPRHRRLRRAVAAVAACGVLLLVGLLALQGGRSATPRADATEPPRQAEPGPALATLPEAAQPKAVDPGASATPEATLAAAATPAPATSDTPAETPAPDAAKAPAASPSPASTAEEAKPANAAPQPAVAPVVASPPPAPRPRPVRRVVREPIDRRCLDAQFRWARGERLGWGEMAYVRNGCTPLR